VLLRWYGFSFGRCTLGVNIAKYCMDKNDKFIIMNKNCGLQHDDISLLLEFPPIAAGFVIEMGGELIAYGQSITLDLDCRAEDSAIIQTALKEGRIRGMWDDICDHWAVGTIDHLPMPDQETMETLQAKRVI